MSRDDAGYCIWNRRTLCIVCRGSRGGLLGAAQQWNAASKGSFVVVPESNIKACAACAGQERAFVASADSTTEEVALICDRCGAVDPAAADANKQ